MPLSFINGPRGLCFLLVGCVAAAAVCAQPVQPAPSTTLLAPVIVTGNPLGANAIAAPVTVLGGDELVRSRGTSLGETLSGVPGVSSSYFGPNANRPIIRGLDGDRVRILGNSGASIDASGLSFDHAVPIDPLAVERIEVLRGPGALLYGGNAIGGVVNAIDNRIPKYSLTGLSGSAEARLGGADRERGGSALLEGGNGNLALHVDAFGRKTSDLLVPRYTPVEADGTVLPSTRHIRNSAARSDGGAIGGSWTFDRGYLGVSADTYASRYGTVAEEDVVIDMHRQHLSLAGEVRDLGGWVRAVRGQINDTRYHHEEIDGSGAIGTTFRSSGVDSRLEVEHAPLGPVKGVIGIQVENVAFSALGDEAFVPTTNTHRRALFIVEEGRSPIGKLSGGVRFEHAAVDSDGDADPAIARFGPAQQRSFDLRSASIGNVYELTSEWSLSGNLSSSARAPTSYELYANGVHAATGAYERGDTALGIERGNNIDAAVQWKAGNDKVRVGVFAAHFPRFISLEASGATIVDANGDAFPEFVFRAVRARFAGIEVEAKHRLTDRIAALDVSAKLDYVHATNLDSGEPLPRIAPLRSTLALDAGSGPWLGRVEWELAARQNRAPATDTETAGYGIVNASLSRRFDFFGNDGFWFIKASNLGDKLAYSASTVQTIRGLVPLAGRSVKAGVRVMF